jgi:integrase
MKNAPIEEYVQMLREGLRGHHLEAIMTLALVTGIRRDELRHLTWSEIDLEKREMHVLNGKTKSSSRLIHLSEACTQVLKQHHLRQMKQKSEANTARTHLDLVFPDGKGGLLSRQLFLEQWDDLLTQAGLPRLRFHNLRVLVWHRLLHEQEREIQEGQHGTQGGSHDLDKNNH